MQPASLLAIEPPFQMVSTALKREFIPSTLAWLLATSLKKSHSTLILPTFCSQNMLNSFLSESLCTCCSHWNTPPSVWMFVHSPIRFQFQGHLSGNRIPAQSRVTPTLDHVSAFYYVNQLHFPQSMYYCLSCSLSISSLEYKTYHSRSPSSLVHLSMSRRKANI